MKPYEVLICVAFGLFFCAVTTLAVWSVRLDSECLALGYPSAQTAITFDRYCVKRLNQTDVVVPLDEARIKGRGP